MTCPLPQGALPPVLTLAVSGQPAGVTAAFSPATLAPGTGVANLTITTPSSATAGTYTLAVTASGGAYSQTINVPLTVTVPPDLGMALASNSLSLVQAAPGTLAVTLSGVGTFSAATSLSLTGLPTGMSGLFSPAAFAAPGAGVSALSLQAAISTPPGKYTVTVAATGGGLVRSLPLAVTVTAAPSFTLATSMPAFAIQAGQPAGSVAVTVSKLTNGFSAPVALSITGLPTGITAGFSSNTFAAPGTGTSTLTLSALGSVTPGQYKLVVTGTGGTVAQSVNLLLTVVGVPGFTLKTDVSSLSLTAGAAFSTTVSVVAQNGFNSTVNLSVGTLPAGVTATLSSNTISNANGTALLTIQTASTLANGIYSLSLSGASSAIPGRLAEPNGHAPGHYRFRCHQPERRLPCGRERVLEFRHGQCNCY